LGLNHRKNELSGSNPKQQQCIDINTQIGLEINIRQGTPTGTIVYTETQTPTTNTNGLISIEIGGGTGFNTINWANGPYFIETKTATTVL